MASFQRLPDRFDPWFVCSPMEVSLCHSGGWSRLCGTMVHTGQVWGWASAVVSGPKTWICGIAIGWMTWSFLSKFGGFHFFHLTITSWPREVMLFAPPLGQLKSQKEAWQRILDNKNIYIYVSLYSQCIYVYLYTVYMRYIFNIPISWFYPEDRRGTRREEFLLLSCQTPIQGKSRSISGPHAGCAELRLRRKEFLCNINTDIQWFVCTCVQHVYVAF